jgi:hypothetical protein
MFNGIKAGRLFTVNVPVKLYRFAHEIGVDAVATRLLLQTFRGGYLRSKDLGNFTLHLGWFDRVNQRDSTNYQKISVAAPNGRSNGAATSDQFAFLGGDYQWSTGLVLKYCHAELQDMYQKNYYGFEHVLPIGEDRFKTDFRYFVSGEAGAAKAGQVDNRNLGVMLTYIRGPHKLGAGFMQLSGSTAMPYLAGTEPLVVSEGGLSTDFLNAHECLNVCGATAVHVTQVVIQESECVPCERCDPCGLAQCLRCAAMTS